MNNADVIICQNFQQDLTEAVSQYTHDQVYILTDETTHELCLPLLSGIPILANAKHIVIGARDTHKNLETLANVWLALSNSGATRHSLMICLGGGMVTDLGGFAASTFKRGIPYINIPTTLLAMVDAAVGGKTAINFNGLKNEIGVFQPAFKVLLETEFLRTLDTHNLLSGYAEMLKHGLISNYDILNSLLAFDTVNIDFSLLKQLVAQSVSVKEDIVKKDPREQNIRKSLNLGHTVGHAFESLAMKQSRPVLHGYAVAWGLVCELYLSHVNVQFPRDVMRRVIHFIHENYGSFPFTCDDYEQLYTYMMHDKKNQGNIINFTLLNDVGNLRLNQTATQSLIYETLDFYRECMGI
ncbi:MAG: 3-dehydroquinate synthase [Bacteroidaceae bacterium]|nr:3-dehydroquinate synthase [Bacteroidaceae bacterium]